MKLMRMGDLCRQLNISRRTFNGWVEADPTLGIFIKGVWWIKLDQLAQRHGISLTETFMLGSSRWVKAVDLARIAGINRRTVAHWCLTRPNFGRRIGRIWYIDLAQWATTPEELEEILSRLSNTGEQ